MAERDADLLKQARRGDAAAVDELLARHAKQVFRFGLRMCGSEADARDVLQETLIAAFRGLPEFRGDADLSTWLYRIARSACIKARRGPQARTGSLDAQAAEAVPSEARGPESAAHAREIGAVLQTAIGALSDAHREVVILKDVEGLTAEAVAKVLGEDVDAVKSRLHRARLELRANLSSLLGEGAAGAGCAELASELGDYAAADIDQAACARIEQHLATCARCKGACDTLQRTVSLCRRIPGDAVPEPVRAAVRHALLATTASNL